MHPLLRKTPRMCANPSRCLRHWRSLILVSLAAAGATLAQEPARDLDAGVSAPSRLKYPPAQRDSAVDTYFGAQVPAPYQWMENLDSPAVQQWVEAENTLTFSYLEKLPVRNWMKDRLTTLWNYARESTPELVAGGRIFFSRNSGLQNQSVVCVQDSPTAAPRELLDPNPLSRDGSVALLGYRPSPHGVYLAYNLSRGGSDWLTIHVRDVATGQDLPDTVRWVKFSGLAWTEDGKGFFYSRYPEPPSGKAISQQVIDQKLYYHRLGTEQSADVLIYARPDLPAWIIGGTVTEDGRYLFVELENGTAPQNELFYLDLGDPRQPSISGAPKPLYTKNDAEYRVVGHAGKTLFIQTTLDAPKRRIVAASLDQPDPAHWRVLVPEGEGVLQGAAMAGGRILVDYQVVAKSRLALFSTDGQPEGEVGLPALGSVSGLASRNDSEAVYYGFTSFLYPESVYRYDLKSAATQVFFKPNVRFDPSPYDLKQVFYPSKDGTKIPMFIVASRNVKLEGDNPTILYGYGGFDITVTPRFNPMLPVWLELGGVYAVANLRGGGTYGETWHEAGMLGRKQNVFDDFAWGAKYLIAQKFTSSRQARHPGLLERRLARRREHHSAPRTLRRRLRRRRRPGHAPLPEVLRRRALGPGIRRLRPPGCLPLALRLFAPGQSEVGRLLSADHHHHGGPRRPRRAEPFLSVRRRPPARPGLRQPGAHPRGDQNQPRLHAHRQAHRPNRRRVGFSGRQPRPRPTAQTNLPGRRTPLN